jgi:hypothetical protein
MHLKGALHVHTTCSDGDLDLMEVIRVHEALGFDFIALTDHDYLLRPGAYDPVLKIDTDLIVFQGKEMTVFERGYCHVNQIQGDRERLHVFNHPAQLDIPVDRVIERIDAVAQKIPIDAVEITTNGFRTPQFEIPEIPYPKVATDDSHTRTAIGRAWVEMDGRRNKDSILRSIRRGDFWNCFKG